MKFKILTWTITKEELGTRIQGEQKVTRLTRGSAHQEFPRGDLWWLKKEIMIGQIQENQACNSHLPNAFYQF